MLRTIGSCFPFCGIKVSAFATSLTICLAIAVSSAALSDDRGPSNRIETPYRYPVRPGTDAWKELTSGDRVTLSQIPSEMVDSMTTPALVESILSHPFLVDLALAGNPSIGWAKMVSQFTGFDELLRRPDVGPALLQAYTERCFAARARGEPYPSPDYAIQEATISYLFLRDDVLDTLRPDQLKLLIRTALAHAALKRSIGGKPHADEAFPLRIALTIVTKRGISVNAEDGFSLDESTVPDDIGDFLRTDRDFIRDGLLEELGAIAHRFAVKR
jgi:hypothetical protein